MARETEAIKKEIEQKRYEIDEDIARLRAEFLERMDWRWQVRMRPFAALGLAAVIGLLAGLIVVR